MSLFFTEQAIDVFKWAIRCFRIEELDDRREGGIEDCPDDIELPSQLLNSNGRDLYDHEIEYSICCCA